jgi:hypothetical protein
MDDNWKDRIAQLRVSRDKFAMMAAERRRDAIELRKKRRWLDALQADGQAAEYRETRDRYSEDLRLAKAQLVRNPYKSSSQEILDNSGSAPIPQGSETP